MTHHAISAQCKGHCCQGKDKDKAVPKTQKGQMSGETGRRQWNKGLRLKEGAASEEGEDIQQDL
jgi:hypothetical protein